MLNDLKQSGRNTIIVLGAKGIEESNVGITVSVTRACHEKSGDAIMSLSLHIFSQTMDESK